MPNKKKPKDDIWQRVANLDEIPPGVNFDPIATWRKLQAKMNVADKTSQRRKNESFSNKHKQRHKSMRNETRNNFKKVMSKLSKLHFWK